LSPPLLAQTANDITRIITSLFTAFLTTSPWAILGAVLPALLLVWYFYSRDKNPEPRTIVIITFVLGALVAVPILIVGIPIRALLVAHLPIDLEALQAVPPQLKAVGEPYLVAFAEAFGAAALPEEVFKFLVVWLYCSRQKAFDEPMDGIVYGATASLGFAALENVLYVSHAEGWAAVALIVGRSLTSVPCHAFLGAIMGYYVGRAKFGGTFRGMLFGLLCSFVLHGLYDFFLMVPFFGSKDWVNANSAVVWACLGGAFVTLVVAGVWTFVLVGRARAEQAQPSS
jgi:protease PrsW